MEEQTRILELAVSQLDKHLATLEQNFLQFRGEVASKFGQIRSEMGQLRGEIGQLRGEVFTELRELRSEIRSSLRWTITPMVTLFGIAVPGCGSSAILSNAFEPGARHTLYPGGRFVSSPAPSVAPLSLATDAAYGFLMGSLSGLGSKP